MAYQFSPMELMIHRCNAKQFKPGSLYAELYLEIAQPQTKAYSPTTEISAHNLETYFDIKAVGEKFPNMSVIMDSINIKGRNTSEKRFRSLYGLKSLYRKFLIFKNVLGCEKCLAFDICTTGQTIQSK